MNDGQLTALVVMKAAQSQEPDQVERVVGWFKAKGFETGPFVGISFAVTADQELFEGVLGELQPPSEASLGDSTYSLAGLDQDVQQSIAAVVVTAPPDFGPGNP